MLEVALLALLAGTITTLAGMGGGMVMVLGLSLTRPVGEALIITTLPLLVGNLHRIRLYRHDLDRPDAWRYAAGGAIGALVGAHIAVALPEVLLRAGIAILALVGVAKLMSDTPWRLPPTWVGPGSVVVGLASATVGGGGVIAGPMLLGRGHTGTAYVGTAAAGAATIHMARIVGYSLAGWSVGSLLDEALLATVTLLAGNVIGHRIRPHLSAESTGRLELGAAGLCASMVLIGIGRQFIESM